jgi:uncharacterized membrane protein
MIRFNKTYFTLTVMLLLIEIFIASFVHDKVIRPYIGDVLVVILLYCFVKSFLKTSAVKTAIGILLFSYLVECLQYFKFVSIIGLQKSKIATTIIGTSFSWLDIVAYTTGIVIVLLLERRISGKKQLKT